MTRMAAGQVRKDFASALSRVAYAKERIVLHRRGKDVAALVPVDDLALLEAIEDRLDLEDARAALAEAEDGGTTRWENATMPAAQRTGSERGTSALNLVP